MITDSHVHLMPNRLAKKIRAFFDDHMDTALAYPPKPEKVLDSHAELGIETVWNLPYAHREDMAQRLNESMADVALQLTGRGVDIVTGCTVHVADDDPAKLLHFAVTELESQVCKLHCSVGDYMPDDDRFTDFWAVAAELRVPVVIHAGHAITGHTEPSELAPIDRVATAHPEVRLIIAHCGHHGYEEALGLTEKHANVYADLTPVVTEIVPLTKEHYAKHKSKLLFGSDAPNTAIHAQKLLRSQRPQMSSDVQKAIFHDNAHRLLNPDD